MGVVEIIKRKGFMTALTKIPNFKKLNMKDPYRIRSDQRNKKKNHKSWGKNISRIREWFVVQNIRDFFFKIAKYVLHLLTRRTWVYIS